MTTRRPVWGQFRTTPIRRQTLFMLTWADFEQYWYELDRNLNLEYSLPDSLYAHRGNFEDKICISFTEAKMRKFLEITGGYMQERFGSGTPGVEYVRLDNKPRFRDLNDIERLVPNIYEPILKHQFEIASWEGDGYRCFTAIVSRMLGTALERKVILSVPHGRPAEYSERGAFQVNIWSSSTAFSERRHHPPDKIWGHSVQCTDRAFQPNRPALEGSVFIKDGDYTVAEVMENALYIHHDLVQTGHTSEFKILIELLNRVADIHGTTNWETHKAQAEAMFRKSQRGTFATFVQKGIPHRMSRLDDEIADTKAKLEQVRQDLLITERKLFNLEHASIDPKVASEQFKTEFGRLSDGSIEHVVDSILYETDGKHCIAVTTDELVAHNSSNGANHLLGRFVITFCLDDGRVVFKNLDRSIRGYNDEYQPAPHVFSSGSPCLGTIENELTSYIANFELEAAVSLTLAFLQTGVVDHDPAGRVIHDFPIYNPEIQEEGMAA